ncbi:unnamed protein product [Lupinus luteus]|uniref:Uncharacterized protein n=1 Tax=Lupinus luteus TaxID=3873 RepID=A0AAV1XJK5_LUPLU
MTRKQLLPPAASDPALRRRPTGEKRRVREVAGGATAECAAVCCCIPCTVMELVVLATYRVPAGLVKKAIEKRKQRRLQSKKSEALLVEEKARKESEKEKENENENKMVLVGPTLEEQMAKEEKCEAVELEKEMWAQFHSAGFWRTSSHHHQHHQIN